MRVREPQRASLAHRVLRPPAGLELAVAVAVLSLAAAAVAVRWDPGGTTFLWNLDLPKVNYPFAAFFHAALGSGTLPLWNDALGLGFPLYAEGQIGTFYPPNWLIFQLSPLDALEVTRLFHLALAGTGAGLLALRVAGTRRGALIAIAVATLGGAVTTKLEWTNVVVAWGWAPWVLLPLVRRPPSLIGLAGAGIAWGIQGLAGHPNTWFLTGVAMVVLVLASLPEARSILRVGAVAAIGIAIAAVQLIPTFVLLRHSVRAGGLTADDLFNNSFTPFDTLGAAFANALVRAGPAGWDLSTSWHPDPAFGVLEAGVYLGLPVLLLAAIGATRPRARPWLVLVGAMVGLAVLGALRPALWAEIPILNGVRHPARAYLFAAFAGGILAAIGVSRPSVAGARRRAAVMLVAAVGLYVAALLGAWNLPRAFEGFLVDIGTFVDADRAAGMRSSAVQALTAPLPLIGELVLGGATLALVVALRRRRRPAGAHPGIAVELRQLGMGALVLLAIAPLALLSPLANERRPREASDWSVSPYVTAAVAAGAHRLLAIDPPGWFDGMPDQLAAATVRDLRMFSSLNLAETDALVARLGSGDDVTTRQAVGVDVVVTFDDHPCPGAVIVRVPKDRATFCRDGAALRPPYWIPVSVVRVEPGTASPAAQPAAATVDTPGALATAVAAEEVTSQAGRLKARVDAPAEGWVYLDIAWWPAWRLAVDGKEIEPLRALGGMLVPVSAGSHEISADLAPWEAVLGAGIGVLGLLGAALMAAAGWRRSRRLGRPPG